MRNIAVFIDRDGVINYDSGNFHKIRELKLYAKVGEAISLLNKNNIFALVVTNQSPIARGWITERQLDNIHKKINRMIFRDNARIDKFYYCPHHPEATLRQYRIDCKCRKPATGMFSQAAKEFNLSLEKSFVIGDTYKEIDAAKKINATSIAVKCGRSEFNESRADFTTQDLYQAVQLVLTQVD